MESQMTANVLPGSGLPARTRHAFGCAGTEVATAATGRFIARPSTGMTAYRLPGGKGPFIRTAEDRGPLAPRW
jgi:hypothetical protein